MWIIVDKIPGKVVDWLEDDTPPATTFSPYETMKRIAFDEPVKHHSHYEAEDSYRSFYGVVAKLGSNVSYTCDRRKVMASFLMNISDPNDQRYTYIYLNSSFVQVASLCRT